MKDIYNYNTGNDFTLNDVKNKQLKSIIKDIMDIQSLQEFHIETIDNTLYICLFDVSQLCCEHIEKVLKKYDLECSSYVTDRNCAMSYLPTTEISTETNSIFNEELEVYTPVSSLF